jgi:hypothetical protein
MTSTEVEPQRRAIDRTRANNSLDSLNAMLEQYTRDADRLAKAGDYVALGGGLGRLRELRQALSTLERHVEDVLAPLLPRKVVEEGGVWMERKSSTNVGNWQGEEVIQELRRRAMTDENGEMHPARQLDRFIAYLVECLNVNGSAGWRRTALRDGFGLQIDEYAKVTPGRTTVRVEQAKSDG